MLDSYSIEIKGKTAALKYGDKTVKKATVSRFVERLIHSSEGELFPGPIPDGVRFVRRRGDTRLIVVELRPQIRRVRWLKESSRTPFGKGSAYADARLAFPFMVVFILFDGEQLTGHQQLFYRVAPITSQDDPLLLPNLLNVAEGYGMRCWLCLQHIENVSKLIWAEKVARVIEHLWVAAFNRSSEVHEGNSLWSAMRHIDPRVSSLEAWEKASVAEPAFPLQVKWTPAGLTVWQVIDQMLALKAPPAKLSACSDVINVLNQCSVDS